MMTAHAVAISGAMIQLAMVDLMIPRRTDEP